MMIAHLPEYWVAGLFTRDEWHGDFCATPQELLDWCENGGYDEGVTDLVLQIAECQLVYQLWWDNIKGI